MMLASLATLQRTTAVRMLVIIFLLSAAGAGGSFVGGQLEANDGFAQEPSGPADLPRRGSRLLFLQLEQPPPRHRPTVPQAWPTSQATGTDQDSDDTAPNGSGATPVDSSSVATAQKQGAKPVKNLLMHLAAINQKLVEDDQSDVPSGTSDSADEDSPSDNQPASVVRPTPLGRRPSAAALQVADASTGSSQNSRSVVRRKVKSGAGALERPQAVTGKPDTVFFGLFGKTFYGVDLKDQEFTIDSVLTLQWTDARAISMVPNGQDDVTLASEEASQKVWMPEVEITNRVARRFDRISSSVTIARTGTITQVERTLAVVKNKFVLNDYPFDKQTLRMNVASTTYMLDEVQLAPGNKAFSGLRKGFFEGEDYIKEDFQVRAYEGIDGVLKKSYGSMEIEVSRSLSTFQRNFLLPAILYLSISCAVFWLPFSPTFVTPRLALSIFILLVFSNLATTADSELPPGAPYNWIDLMCFTIQLHMFTVVCLNIFTEIAYHSMKCTTTAVHISNELKVVAPLVASISMATILVASTNPEGAFGLKAMTIIMPVAFIVFVITYLSCCGSTLSAEIARNARSEQLQSKEFYPGGNMGPLASSESLAPAPEQ